MLSRLIRRAQTRTENGGDSVGSTQNGLIVNSMVWPTRQALPPVGARALIAATQIEDHRERSYFLRVRDQKLSRNDCQTRWCPARACPTSS